MDEETKAKLLDAGENVRKLRAEFTEAYDEEMAITRVAGRAHDRTRELMHALSSAEVELAAIARGPETKASRAG